MVGLEIPVVFSDFTKSVCPTLIFPSVKLFIDLISDKVICYLRAMADRVSPFNTLC